jgi:hypothetical protein
MNQPSATPGRPAARAPVFFWITIAQLALLLLSGVAAAVWLVFEAKSINRSGGWGWLLVGALCVVATTIVCASCAFCTAVSLFRRERHRGLSIAILVVSGLVVVAFGPMLVPTVRRGAFPAEHSIFTGREFGRHGESRSCEPADSGIEIQSLGSHPRQQPGRLC